MAADKKLYTQGQMDRRIRCELAEAQEKHEASVSQLHSEIRHLKDQCKRKDGVIKTLSVAIENFSMKGN